MSGETDYAGIAALLEAAGLASDPLPTAEEQFQARAKLEEDQRARNIATRRIAGAKAIDALKRHNERKALLAAGEPYVDDNGDIVEPSTS